VDWPPRLFRLLRILTMSDTTARSDAGTTPTSGALLVALAPLLSMVEDHAAEIAPAVVADAARRARLTIGALITERDDAAAERERLVAASPDDLREQGWAVAVHNDYRLNGERFTFWLLTRGDRCVKGEGRTDADALNEIRRALTSAREEAAAQEAFACGCVTCICEDRVRCHGCGARLCGKPDDECDWLNGRSTGKEPNDGLR
jgi:hypothetical protein